MPKPCSGGFNTESMGLTDEITDTDINLAYIRPRFQVLHKHLAIAFSFLWVDIIWQNFAFCMLRDEWTECNTNKYIFAIKR